MASHLSSDVNVPNNTLEDYCPDQQQPEVDELLKVKKTHSHQKSVEALDAIVTNRASVNTSYIGTVQKCFQDKERSLEGLQINTSPTYREEEVETTPKGFGDQSDYQSLPSNRDFQAQAPVSSKNEIYPREENLVERYEKLEAPQSAKKPKIVHFDVKKVNAQPVEDEQREFIEQLRNENRILRIQLEATIARNENLASKLKESEDSKTKSAGLTRKFEDQLRSLNNNYCTLQKKVSGLEKENKDLANNLKVCETEKKSLSEKWQKLSKKTRTEDNYKINCQNLEAELGVKNKEIEELLEKFYLVKAELQIHKEKETKYKKTFVEHAQTMKYFEERFEAEKREKDFLVSKNLELLEKLEKVQGLLKASQSKIQQKEEQNEQEQNAESQIQGIVENVSVVLQPNEDIKQNGDGTKEDNGVEAQKKNLNEDLDCTLFFSKESFGLQALALNYDSSSDQALADLKAEVKDKLGVEEFEKVQKHIESHISFVNALFTSNDVVDKYNKLLLHYLKALEKNKTVEKPSVGVALKTEFCDNESLQFGANSTIEPAGGGFIVFNPSAYNSSQTPNAIIKNPTESLVCDKTSLDIMNYLQSTQEKKPQNQVFIEIHNEFMEMDRNARSKSAEKSKSTRKSYREERTERKTRGEIKINPVVVNKDIKTFEPTTPDKTRSRLSPFKREAPRSGSVSKTNRSYHEIHLQRRKEPQVIEVNIADYCQTNKVSEK